MEALEASEWSDLDSACIICRFVPLVESDRICAGPQHRTPSSGHVTEIHEQ